MMSPAPYDAIAAWYDAFVRDETHAGNFGLPYLMQLIGDVRGQMICDLACGQGRVARMLAYLGARVVGVDISSELLTMARAEEGQTPLGIDYVLDDAQAIASIADEQFDGVVCNLGLTDIPELSATFQAVNR